MDLLTLFLVILGTLIVAAGLTLLLDVLASYCFRPFEAKHSIEGQVRGN